jgi:hypothetical protein
MNLPSSDPQIYLGQLQRRPGLVASVLTVRMVAGIDREDFDPDFSEILLSLPNWGKILSSTVQ